MRSVNETLDDAFVGGTPQKDILTSLAGNDQVLGVKGDARANDN